MKFKLGKVHKIRVKYPGAKESVPETIPAKGCDIRQRKRWKNYVSNQIIEPLQYRKPLTLDELIEIMALAQKTGCKLKAVGSGHSFSDILQTTDVLIDCHGLNRPIPLDKELLHEENVLADRGYSLRHLVHVENGMRIRELNKHLDRQKLALENMGGYDGQTIAGVVSTSTHGTGIKLGPISDSVASLILVGENGKVYRVEPTNGITDPEKYKRTFPDNILIQEDDFFNAVVVSMGCMGLIYSFILKVRDRFYLSEKREEVVNEKCWEDLRQKNRIKDLLEENEHLEIWVNPYEVDGKHSCLVTKRNTYHDDITRLPEGSLMRHWFIENVFLRYFTCLPPLLFSVFHKKTPQLISASMRGVIDKDGYINKSFKVMNLGSANNVRGYASEYAVSLKDDLFVKAVDRIIALAEKNKILGEIYHTAPISLRFVKQSSAFLSMMHGEDKCMIEVPLIYQTKGRFQILDKLEDELFAVGHIRPHWGQYHNLGKETVKALYPELNKWLKVYKQMNSTGVFSNTFTDRCGFDS